MTMNPRAWIAAAVVIVATSASSRADTKNEVRAVTFAEDGGVTSVHQRERLLLAREFLAQIFHAYGSPLGILICELRRRCEHVYLGKTLLCGRVHRIQEHHRREQNHFCCRHVVLRFATSRFAGGLIGHRVPQSQNQRQILTNQVF